MAVSCDSYRNEDVPKYLIDSIHDYAIFMLDGSGRVASWNSGAERILGYAAAEIIGRHFSCFFTNEDVQDGTPQLELERAAATGSASAEGWRVRKDGTWFWGSGVTHCLHNQPLRGFVKVMRDLTESKLADDRVREETQIAETLHRIGTTIAAELDLNRILQKVIDAARMLTRAEVGTFLYLSKKDDFHSETVHATSRALQTPDDTLRLPMNVQLLQSALSSKRPVRLADVSVDERLGPMVQHSAIRSFLAVPVIAREGSLLGGLVFGHSGAGEFTERDERLLVGIAGQAAAAIDNAQLYQEACAMRDLLRRQNAEFAEADRRKNEFLAMLGHELRNPLAPISNALHIIRHEENVSPIIQQAASMAERQVKQLTCLVDDLIDVARITRGTIQLHKERITLVDVLTRAIETVQPLIDSHQHQLSVSYPRSTIWLSADPVRLQQVVVNLLTNAAKYTPRGGYIALNAQMDRGEVIVTVKDTGVGIAPDLLNKVFDLFTQAERTLARSEGGLGIGLTMVRRLVEMHGGIVEAHSAGVGQGSEFIVRLPVLKEPLQVGRAPARMSDTVVESNPLRVLVVDDNIDAAQSMAMMLSAYGHEIVAVCHDGATATKEITEQLPDVVLLDIGLPIMNGYEVAQQVRARLGDAPVRLIAVTGYGQQQDRQQALEAGFDEHLVKPVEPNVLQSLLMGASVQR